MPQEQKQPRVETVIALLDEQCARLKAIHDQYRTGFDAIFDEHSADATLQRWKDRTYKLIREQIGNAEANNFRRALGNEPRGRGAWHWGELCQYLHTYIVRLIEDIEQYPDDPSYDRLNEAGNDSLQSVSPASKEHDVFLSYSSLDKDEARDIHKLIAKARRKCFLAEKNLKPGDKFRDEIRDALESAVEVWILVSPNSVKSDWVRREAAAAWALKKRMVPILLRCSVADLPEEIADVHAIDYHKVDELIKDLGRRSKRA